MPLGWESIYFKSILLLSLRRGGGAECELNGVMGNPREPHPLYDTVNVHTHYPMLASLESLVHVYDSTTRTNCEVYIYILTLQKQKGYFNPAKGHISCSCQGCRLTGS